MYQPPVNGITPDLGPLKGAVKDVAKHLKKGVLLVIESTINPAIGFMFGYAGGDVLENIYKILVQKPILGPFNTVLKKSTKK